MDVNTPVATTTAPAPTTGPRNYTPAEMIERYLKVRVKKTELVKAQKAELKKYDEALEYLENMLLAALNKAGLQNFKSAAGTAYKTEKITATSQDWPVVLDYIRENEAWDMLTSSLSKDAVLARLEEVRAYFAAQAQAQGMAPEDAEAYAGEHAIIPGVKISSEYQVNVRKG